MFSRFSKFSMRRAMPVILFLVCFLSNAVEASGSKTKLIKLNVVKNKDHTKVMMKFNRPIDKDPPVEFFRNVIQLSFENVQAWPTQEVEISNNSDSSDLEKALAYQFNPKFARVRVMLQGSSDPWKGKEHLEMVGENLTLTIPNKVALNESAMDQVRGVLSGPVRATKSETKPLPRSEQEEAIIQEVIKGGKRKTQKVSNTPVAHFEKDNTETLGIKTVSAVSGVSSENSSETTETEKSESPGNLTMGVKEPVGMKTFGKTFLALFSVVAMIVLFVFAFKKFTGSNGKFIDFMPSRKNKVIEILESKFLGPKRSLNLVKVANKYVLIGIAGDSISNLMELENNRELQAHLEGKLNGDDFEAVLTNSDKPLEGQAPIEEMNTGKSNWGPVVDRLFQGRKNTAASSEKTSPALNSNALSSPSKNYAMPGSNAADNSIGTSKLGASAYKANAGMRNTEISNNESKKVRSQIKNRVKDLRSL